jgi:hypothetical protein
LRSLNWPRNPITASHFHCQLLTRNCSCVVQLQVSPTYKPGDPCRAFCVRVVDTLRRLRSAAAVQGSWAVQKGRQGFLWTAGVLTFRKRRLGLGTAHAARQSRADRVAQPGSQVAASDLAATTETERNDQRASVWRLYPRRMGLPLPKGLESLGKRRKEFAADEGPSRAERAGASESLGRGEGEGTPRRFLGSIRDGRIVRPSHEPLAVFGWNTVAGRRSWVRPNASKPPRILDFSNALRTDQV